MRGRSRSWSGANLADWQARGFVPDSRIEPGDKTDEPIRTRGWTHWHHLFTPRHLLSGLMLGDEKLSRDCLTRAVAALALCRLSITCRGYAVVRGKSPEAGCRTGRRLPNHVFYNQALNTFSTLAAVSFLHASMPVVHRRRPRQVRR